MVYNNDKHRYDYMLNMKRPESKKRKRMSIEERAAQFGAFRALTGYEDAITETARLTDPRFEKDEYEKAEIDLKLQYIREHLHEHPKAAVSYFIPDNKKSGGTYTLHKGCVCKIREFEKQLVFDDGIEIPIEDIISIDGDVSAT